MTGFGNALFAGLAGAAVILVAVALAPAAGHDGSQRRVAGDRIRVDVVARGRGDAPATIVLDYAAPPSLACSPGRLRPRRQMS